MASKSSRHWYGYTPVQLCFNLHLTVCACVALSTQQGGFYILPDFTDCPRVQDSAYIDSDVLCEDVLRSTGTLHSACYHYIANKRWHCVTDCLALLLLRVTLLPRHKQVLPCCLRRVLACHHLE